MTTQERMQRLIEALPTGGAVTLGRVGLEALVGDNSGAATEAPPTAAATEASWRERLWEVPAETRIGVAELAEAMGRSKHWVYRHTSRKSIPFRKLDGELVFIVREVRDWLATQENQ